MTPRGYATKKAGNVTEDKVPATNYVGEVDNQERITVVRATFSTYEGTRRGHVFTDRTFYIRYYCSDM